jgi:hypothetical protein
MSDRALASKNTLSSLVDSALTDPLAPARTRAAGNMRVIGLMSADVPIELVVASRAFPLLLPPVVGAPTPLADRYLESGFGPAVRSILEQWLAGAFDFIDSVIFTRSNDSEQRLYYYLCELQRRGLVAGPRPLLYDLAKIERVSSERHSEVATRRLADQLGSDPHELAAAIHQRNNRRKLFQDLGLKRESSDPPTGVSVARMSRAADLNSSTSFDDALAGWLQSDFPRLTAPRVLLAGSAPADERMHAAVEAAGGCVVDEYGDHSLRRLGTPVPTDREPIEALSRHYQTLPYGPRIFGNRAAELVRRAVACHADGVIFWLSEQDDSLVWHTPAVLGVLRSASLPLLSLTRRQWEGDDETMASIRAFTSRLEPST